MARGVGGGFLMHRRDTEDAEFSGVGGGRRDCFAAAHSATLRGATRRLAMTTVVMCDTGRRCGRLMILTREM